MKYIFVYYLPGSAGNFFSRCLNLLDNAYCFVVKKNSTLPTTLTEKIDLLSYNSVIGEDFATRDWIKFESKLSHYSVKNLHWDLPKNSYSVWPAHPDTKHHDLLPGDDNIVYKFYIDSSECFEWGIMNALYKNSYLDVKWFINGKDLKNNNDIHKINLKNIINSKEGFLIEFNLVCNIIDHILTDAELTAVGKLYDQWILTVLKETDILEFKKSIEFLM